MSQTNKKATNSFRDMLLGGGICMAAGFICFLIISLVMSIIVASADLSDAALTVMAFVCIASFAAVTGFLTGKAFSKNKLTAGLINGIILAIIWVIANIVSFRAPMSALTFVKLIVIILITTLCAVLTKNRKKRQNRR